VKSSGLQAAAGAAGNNAEEGVKAKAAAAAAAAVRSTASMGECCACYNRHNVRASLKARCLFCC
jgi:hypothetical protein